MAYEPILPNDTANEITEFIQDRYVGAASQMAAADAIESEIAKVVANPSLGAPVYGGPFESRRIHRFTIEVTETTRTVEFAYKINPGQSVVFSGFREVPPTPL